MTNFQYWQEVANTHGLVMCVLCFENKTRDEMHTDENGDTWDACEVCHQIEQKMMKERGLIE